MILHTSRFGELEIDDQLIYEFHSGIPGFEDLKRFVIVTLDEQDGFSYLQSVDQGDFSFIIVNPFDFFPQYTFDLPEQAITELAIEHEQEVAVWAIVTVKDDLEQATVNLAAPLVFNIRTKLGMQVILVHRNYETRQPLFQPLKEV